jgi:hypothetical protein
VCLKYFIINLKKTSILSFPFQLVYKGTWSKNCGRSLMAAEKCPVEGTKMHMSASQFTFSEGEAVHTVPQALEDAEGPEQEAGHCSIFMIL